MRYQPESHAREPFPWLGILFGTGLGLTIAIVAPWIAFELRDTNLLNIR